jgi:hypothetical protein
MLHQLKRHPFPVKAYFDFSLVLTYAFPKKQLEPMLPPGLELDTFGDYAFVAVAMVQTRKLRPFFVPSFLGRDFFLSGYRIFVKYHTQKGKRYRGLFILRSDTDNGTMQKSGNLLTHYNYHHTDIAWQKLPDGIEVKVRSKDRVSDADIKVQYGNEATQLPQGSVFTNWKEARRFAGPLPFTFDYEKETHSIIFIEGVRENWVPAPLQVEKADLQFFNSEKFKNTTPVLSNAFITEQIPYRWKKGVREKL